MKMKIFISGITPRFLYPLGRGVYYFINGVRYAGKNVYCSICERSYKTFLPGGEKRRPNAKCPGCGTLERHRLLWLYLANKLEIGKRKIKLLDIAPDQTLQRKLKFLANINYISVDIDSVHAMKKMDLTDLNFPDETFDAVICYHVLEHIENDKKAMKEIFRVLKRGGWSILQSPVDINRRTTFEDSSIKLPEEREKIFGQKDHVRIYGRDYSTRLSGAGFNVKEDTFIKEFSKDEIVKYGLDEEEIIYLCTKRY